MFVVERTSLLAAVEAVLPLVEPGAVAVVEAAEPDALTVTVAHPGRGARGRALGRVLLPGSVSLPLAPLARALRCGVGRCRVEVAANATAVALVIDPDAPTARKFVFEVDRPAGPAPAPAWPEIGSGCEVVNISAGAFADLVDRTAFVATSGPAPAGAWATSAVQLTSAGGRLTAAATDTYRLARASCAAEGGSDPRGRATLVPAGAIRAWARAAKKGGETVRLGIGARVAVFEVGAVSAWAAAPAGPFPDWAAAVPDPPHSVALPTDRFLAELRAAVAVADPDEPKVLLALKPGALTLSAAVAGRARAALTVPLPGFAGPPVRVPLDGRRLLKVVEAYRAEAALVLKYGTGVEPVALVAGADCACVLAPMIERGNNGGTGD